MRDSMLYSLDYHIHVKNEIISIDRNSTRITNPNLLILWRGPYQDVPLDIIIWYVDKTIPTL